MCIYNRIIDNAKYKANKKNGGVIPHCHDERVKKVPIGCNNCIECRRKKANDWKVRLLEDIKTNTTGKFITLTYSTEWLRKLIKEIPIRIEGYDIDNAVATLSMRRFLERYRKEHKKSLRHWFITELGHGSSEHMHMHGIVWLKGEKDWKLELDNVEKHWKYGYVWKGKMKNGSLSNYVNNGTIGYMTKYVTKIDFHHKYYKPIILCSDGIGKNYTETRDSRLNKYKANETIEYYRSKEGYKMAMPIYWRNKLYSEEEREKLWVEKLDKNERFVLGTKIDMNKNEWEYERAVEEARKINKELGYGGLEDDNEKLQRKIYQNELRTLKLMARIKDDGLPPAGTSSRSIQKGQDI